MAVTGMNYILIQKSIISEEERREINAGLVTGECFH